MVFFLSIIQIILNQNAKLMKIKLINGIWGYSTRDCNNLFIRYARTKEFRLKLASFHSTLLMLRTHKGPYCVINNRGNVGESVIVNGVRITNLMWLWFSVQINFSWNTTKRTPSTMLLRNKCNIISLYFISIKYLKLQSHKCLHFFMISYVLMNMNK